MAESLLGHIRTEQADGNVEITVGTVTLTYSPYQARQVAAEIIAAADDATVLRIRARRTDGLP